MEHEEDIRKKKVYRYVFVWDKNYECEERIKQAIHLFFSLRIRTNAAACF